MESLQQIHTLMLHHKLQYMNSEIKDFYGTNIEYPLDKFIPKIHDNFGFLLNVEVGLTGQEGADYFDIFICTPKWLISNMKKEDFVIGLHYLIVFEYNFESLKRKLNELFCIEGNNWIEIATKLSYIGHWEFQNYKE